MKKNSVFVVLLLLVTVLSTGCAGEWGSAVGSYEDVKNTKDIANKIQHNQPTPVDIEYSLERYNLIRRAYWVNGQREKAISLACPISKPLGYIVLFTPGGSVVGRFIVDGKVSSLNSYLTPDSEHYEEYGSDNEWLADIDGSYGENDNGIFFFTPDGKYLEWTGIYLYSDIPFEVNKPVLKVETANE